MSWSRDSSFSWLSDNKYQKKEELEFVSPSEGFKTIKVENIVEKPFLIDEKECALANGEEESWSNDAEDAS